MMRTVRAMAPALYPSEMCANEEMLSLSNAKRIVFAISSSKAALGIAGFTDWCPTPIPVPGFL